MGQARTVPVTGERLALYKSVMVLFVFCVHTAGLIAFLHLPSLNAAQSRVIEIKVSSTSKH